MIFPVPFWSHMSSRGASPSYGLPRMSRSPSPSRSAISESCRSIPLEMIKSLSKLPFHRQKECGSLLPYVSKCHFCVPYIHIAIPLKSITERECPLLTPEQFPSSPRCSFYIIHIHGSKTITDYKNYFGSSSWYSCRQPIC